MSQEISLANMVQVLPIAELKEYENNPRRIGDDAIEAVANSIRQFGFKSPIIIDKDNVIVAGHTRLAAAKKLGLKEVPCIVADDLSEEQVRAYRLADNKTAELSGWDFIKLDIELEGILDIDMAELGFDKLAVMESDYIDDFFDRGNEAKQKNVKYEVRVPCKDEAEQKEVFDFLKEAGYAAVMP